MVSDSSLDCIAGFSRAVDLIDTKEGPYALLDAIAGAVTFRTAISVIYSRDAGPAYVCDTFSDRNAKRALGRYISSTYVLNPVYNAYLAGLDTGIYRIRELAPDAYFSSELYQNFEIHRREDEEIGYRTHGWPGGLEELVIAVTLPHDQLAEISLSRLIREGGFSDECIVRLRTLLPLIASLVRRCWPNIRLHAGSGIEQEPLDRLMEGFGENILSPREREVVQLILKGHSSQSIGSLLDISVATVKSHRQNLYAKLAISTQQELFSRSLAWLQSRRPAQSHIGLATSHEPQTDSSSRPEHESHVTLDLQA